MKIGIVGTGMIIQNAGSAMKEEPGFTIASILSRPHSLEKAKSLSGQFGIPNIYTDYREFLADPEIEAVYVGIINSQHYSYAREALLAGKHVIVEKPFTLTLKEGEELADLARSRNRIILEAIHLRYHPWLAAVKEGLKEIGRVKLIRCDYSKVSSRYREYVKGNVLPVFDPAQGGGALYDIGVYCVHFADAILGEEGAEPEVSYTANRGYNGVDTSGTLVLRYPEALAVCTCGKDSDGACRGVVQGEEGYLEIENFPRTTRVVLYPHGGDGPKVLWKAEKAEENPLKDEFHAFAAVLSTEDRRRAEEALEKSLRVMRVLDAALVEKGK